MRLVALLLPILMLAGCSTVPHDVLSIRTERPQGAARKAVVVKAKPKPQKRAVVNVKTGPPVVAPAPAAKPKGRFRRAWDRFRGR